MKKFTLVLISITLIFSSCKEDKTSFPFPCLCSNTNNIVATNSIATYAPNCFTPNNDYHNDLFRVVIYDVINSQLLPYTLSVNGIQLYIDTVNNSYNNTGWNGDYSTDADYGYHINYNYNGTSYQMNGTVSLVRNINNMSFNFTCYPQGISNCTFGDMIDPQLGFIYPTAEDILNW